MRRFSVIVCKVGLFGFHVELAIPWLNLRGSEPTDNVDDVLSLLIKRYNVTESEAI